jgi:FkbM family methyltransferase
VTGENRIRTGHLRQKAISRRILGQTGFDVVRMVKNIVSFKLGRDYEVPAGILRRLVPEGGVVFDVGANIGQYMCRFSELTGRSGRTYCFEPVRRNFELLARTRGLLRLSNVTCVNMALGCEPRTAQIAIPSLREEKLEVATQASLDIDFSTFENARFRTETVVVETLDRFFLKYRLGRLDLIKLDTEGHDNAILEGAANTVRRLKPALLMEEPPNPQLGSRLAPDARYAVYWVGSEGILPLMPETPRQDTYLVLPEGHPLRGGD